MSVQVDDTTARLSALWRSVLPSAAEIRRARRRLHTKATVIAVLVALSYWVLVISSSGFWLRIGSAGVLVGLLIAVATNIMHDANHGAFSRWAWVNRLASYTGDALGASSWLWRFKHNTLHHGSTNVEGVDSDILQAPIARLAPGQEWKPWHRLQHIYLWPLYGFMTLKNVLFGDLTNLIKAEIGEQALRRKPKLTTVLGVITGKLAHITWALVIPILFNPWWAVILFYVAMSWLVGFSLAVIFQVAHCVEGVEFVDESTPHRGRDFIPHQLATTKNVATTVPVLGPAFRWLVGGLDHQIEHHLAPRLPHTVYRSVGTRFQAGCGAIGVEYREHPGMWSAVRSHGRWLREMGRPVPALPGA
ncbi:MAG: acyl-CoA desaturase [Acidimicrobiales bacterium]